MKQNLRKINPIKISRKLILFVCLNFFVNFVYGQFCGTTINNKAQKKTIEVKSYSKSRNRNIIRIPVKIHFVKPDISFAFLSNKIEELINSLNIEFEGTGIEFHHCGVPNFIQRSERIFDRASAVQLGDEFTSSDKANVFVVDRIDIGRNNNYGGFGTIPTEYNKNRRYVFITYGSLNRSQILGHEFGHLFGLYHTHETYFGEELVNGENCEETGDLICDTPADPNLAETTVRNCNYAGKERDENGDSYKPDTRNIMSYADTRCTDEFSDGQILVMRENIQNSFNFRHSCISVPQKTVIYPNPVEGVLTTKIKNEIKGVELNIRISDVFGRILENIKGFKSDESYYVIINCNHLNQGVYHLSISYSNNKKSESYKFIKK